MKTLQLHVGFHKTATSSFQRTCAENYRILEKQGIHYPSFSYQSKPIENHSIPLFSLFTESPEYYHVNIRRGFSNQIEEVNQTYRRQLDEALENHEHVVLSGEDVSMLSRQGLTKLREHIQRAGFNIEVYCCVRKPYSFTCSALQEQIKGGTPFNPNSLKVVSRINQVRRLKAVFGNVQFASFEDYCRHPQGPVVSLMEHMGWDTSEISVKTSNEGLGNKSTRLYMEINKQFPVIENRRLNPRGRSQQVCNFDSDKFLLTSEELNRVKKALDRENEALERLLGKEFTDGVYPTSDVVTLSLAEAQSMLAKAANPQHVRPAVMRFVCKHSDGSWQRSDLENPPTLASPVQIETSALAAENREKKVVNKIKSLFISLFNR